MFKTRLISGIALVAILIAVILLGNNVLLFTLLGVSLIGMMELYRVYDIHKTPLAIASYIAIAAYYVNLQFNFLLDSGVNCTAASFSSIVDSKDLIFDSKIIFIVLLVVLLMFYVFSYPKYKANQIMAAFFGVFYVGVMLSYIYLLRNNSYGNGIHFAFIIFLCSWGSDTCAYCVGMLCNKTIGTHKMAPVLSPKKSIEGAVGGVVGAGLLTLIYVCIFKNDILKDSVEGGSINTRMIVAFIIIAMITAFVSMIGDLAASAIKRNYDIKDYGKLIPGHGGILDRFDSVIITAPILYYLITFVIDKFIYIGA